MNNQKKVNPEVVTMVWRHWLPAFRKSKAMLAGIILFYSLAIYCELLYRPTKWKEAFDQLVYHANPWHAFLWIAAASATGWLCNRIGDRCIALSEMNIIKNLKDYCLNGLLLKSTHFFTHHPSGALVAKVKRFAHVAEMVIDELSFTIVRTCLFVLCLMVYLWISIPQIMPLFAVWLVLFTATTLYFSHKRMELDLATSSADSATTGHLSDILLSVFILRMFAVIPKVRKSFSAITNDERQKRKVAWLFGNMQWATQGILVMALELSSMYFIIHWVQQGLYSVGTAVMVQAYIASLSMYMWNLGKSLVRVRGAFADAYEMTELLEEHSTEPIDAVVQDEYIADNSVVFSNITFNYLDGNNIIKDFSFNFIGGRRYGLIGKTGSGKSTLMRLLLRSYNYTDGSITIGGKYIDTLHKFTLRSFISYVPQDPQFPSWSVREIIRMGNQTATDDMVRDAAEKACCDFIWEKLPLGYDTVIGERGVLLSGGERQRLAIAAAILKNAPIVIMDEPTSALDAKTEYSIQQSIENHFEGKTLIIIAHRLATVAVLDEIILLENGAIKDFGPHDSLLQSSSEYREMWELQTNPQALAH